MAPSPLRLSFGGVAGTLGAGMVIAISSFSIVLAEHGSGVKGTTFSCNAGTACVEGDSTGKKTYGAYGLSGSSDGVHGLTSATGGGSGVAGISNGTTGSGHGVYGKSSNGQGVYGTSSSSNGVEGNASAANAAGVRGTSSSAVCASDDTTGSCAGVFGTNSAGAGYGVWGDSGSYGGVIGTVSGNGTGVTGAATSAGIGVYGDSATGSGVVADTDGSNPAAYALVAEGFDFGSTLFRAWNQPNNRQCTIDQYTNLACDGTVTGGTDIKVRHTNSKGRQVLAYAAQSASETIDDVGTGRMVGGLARVAIDQDFSSAIDPNKPYHVFLTPMGDTRGLYVSLKTRSGFEVRESQGGRSTVEFDYRIVANPIDGSIERLPNAPTITKPQGKRPAARRELYR
jgi:hypothetical protein